MPRIRLNLTSKMMLFAAVIAVLPLLVAGQSLIRVTRDELKSAANDQIAGAARKLTGEFNDFFEYSLLTPLDLIRNAIGGDKPGVAGKDRGAEAGHCRPARRRGAAGQCGGLAQADHRGPGSLC